MGFRFQRRVKIAPGLTLVVSKRGVGVSAGVTGARVSATPSGIFAHGGLPGTGLAYREKLNKKGRSRSGRSSRPGTAGDSAEGIGLEVTISIEDNGAVSLRHQNGEPIPKETQDYLKKKAKDQLRAVLDDYCAKQNRTIQALSEVHLGTPAPTSEPVFEPREFSMDKPIETQQLRGNLWTAIWPPAKRRLAAENSSRQEQYAQQLNEWIAARTAFETTELTRKQRELSEVRTDLEAMTEVLADHLSRIPWPKETEVCFDLGDDSKTIAIELSLPEADDFSCEECSVHGSQLRIIKRKLSVTRAREIYSNYVHGIAFRVLGEVFARLPTVQVALVNGWVPKVDGATGRESSVALFSVMATREQFSQINFDALKSVDPGDSLTLFKLRRNMTKTGIFKPVSPMGVDDLDGFLQNGT